MDPLHGDARRILIDISQLYEAYLDTAAKLRSHRGGMKWIKRNGKEYLFRQRNSRGDGKSLGPRNEQAEQTYQQFHARKAQLTERYKSLKTELKRQSRFCVAAQANRVPTIAADIVRVISEAQGGSNALIVVGTHALYAYENLAGVRFESDMLATTDIDLLWDTNRKLTLSRLREGQGLLALLQKADKTFERLSGALYRAANAKGFMVDLIKPMPSPPHKITPDSITDVADDLVAAEIENLHWLYAAPTLQTTVVGRNGFPVVFDVPDPRVFAAHKLWVSEQPTRSAMKKDRDRRQGLAVLQMLKEHLPQYPLDDAVLKGLPVRLRERMLEAYDQIEVPVMDEVPGL